MLNDYPRVASIFDYQEVAYLQSALSMYTRELSKFEESLSSGRTADEWTLEGMGYRRYYRDEHNRNLLSSLKDNLLELYGFANLEKKDLLSTYREKGDDVNAKQVEDILLLDRTREDPEYIISLLLDMEDWEKEDARENHIDFLRCRVEGVRIEKLRKKEIEDIRAKAAARVADYKSLHWTTRFFVWLNTQFDYTYVKRYTLSVEEIFRSSSNYGKDYLRIALWFDQEEIDMMRSAFLMCVPQTKRGMRVESNLSLKLNDAKKFLDLEEKDRLKKHVRDLEQNEIKCLVDDFAEYRAEKRKVDEYMSVMKRL